MHPDDGNTGVHADDVATIDICARRAHSPSRRCGDYSATGCISVSLSIASLVSELGGKGRVTPSVVEGTLNAIRWRQRRDDFLGRRHGPPGGGHRVLGGRRAQQLLSYIDPRRFITDVNGNASRQPFKDLPAGGRHHGGSALVATTVHHSDSLS